MFDSLKAQLEAELQQIRAAGLYKDERVLASPQGTVSRICFMGLAFAFFASVAGNAPARGNPSAGAFHIAAPQREIGPGEHVELRLVPTPPPDVRVTWHLMSTPSEKAFYGAVYRAPYVVPPDAPSVAVGVGISGKGWRTSATTTIKLSPGAVPGADDCLGPGQSFSPTEGDIVWGGGLPDELPELIQRVEPEYPRSTFVRGVEDTIAVNALVCRSGRVLDAYALQGFRSLHPEVPIEHDRLLVEAALAAVRQYVFKPALVSGQPIATWVAVAVLFAQ